MKNKVIKAVLRGIVKSIPLGNAVIEGVKNVKSSALKTPSTDKPHSWISIITQLMVVGLILWAVLTGKLDVVTALEWLK